MTKSRVRLQIFGSSSRLGGSSNFWRFKILKYVEVDDDNDGDLREDGISGMKRKQNG